MWKEGRRGKREERREGGREDGHCPPRAGGSSKSGVQQLQPRGRLSVTPVSKVLKSGLCQEPGLTIVCLGSLPSSIWNLLLVSVIPPISGSEAAISPGSGPKKGRHRFSPHPHFLPRREDCHVPGLLPTAGEHHACLPQLPGTGQRDCGDVLRILLPESKRNFDFTALSFNHPARVVVSGRGRCLWGTAAVHPPWSPGGS